MLQAVPCSSFLVQAQRTSYRDEHAPKFMTGVSLHYIMGSTLRTIGFSQEGGMVDPKKKLRELIVEIFETNKKKTSFVGVAYAPRSTNTS